MNRRELLAALAAGTAVVPGCLDGDSNGPGDGSPSPTPTQTPTGTVPVTTDSGTPDTETDTGTASGEFVREAFAVPELAAPNSPDSFGVYGARDEQYVVALLDGAAASRPAVDEIALVADGGSHDAQNSVGYGGWALFDYGGAYDPVDNPAGWVVCQLPDPLDVESAAITWPGGEYPLGDDVLADLARPPASFEITSFDAPASATQGETFTLSLAVENTGDVDGTFVGAVNRNFPAYAPVASIRLPVAAGETATWEREVTVDDVGYEGSGELRLWLYWRDDSADQQVTVAIGTDSDDGTRTQGTDSLDGTQTQGTEPAGTATDPDGSTRTDGRGGTRTETDPPTETPTPTATTTEPITPEPSE
ncbi:hypothetical protein [Halosimplex salinum]|uniref:hypothetical protein n=1 Tax=Halosimplex salinum TaxID=1710538 RepID=UPI000F47785C|nr:hypothetical protein [Halosimplex salinum]